MKLAVQSLLITIVILIIIVGFYYFSEQPRLDGRLSLLQEELSQLKHDKFSQNSKSILIINSINKEIESLKENFKAFENTFLEWKEAKESEIERTKKTLLSLQQHANELAFSLQSYIKELI